MGRTSDAKENLIESAMQLIGTRSYNTVGVQELCEHAGVKKGSFYHFFPSKRDLTLEALDVMWEKFRESTLEPALSSDKSTIEKFNTILGKSYQYQVSAKDCFGCVTGCSIGNLALELSTQDELIRRKIEEIFEEWAKYFEDIIREAVDNGDLPQETDPHATSQAILAYIEGVSLMSKTFNDPGMINRLGEGIFSLCIRKKEKYAG